MTATKTKPDFPDPITEDDARALIHRCDRRTPTGRRDRALIAFLFSTGLRVSEALTVTAADFKTKTITDPKTDTPRAVTYVRVRFGKGGSKDPRASAKARRAREVVVRSFAVDYLDDWNETRRALRIAKSAPLFCAITKGKRGRPLGRSVVNRMLDRRADQARERGTIGPEVYVHPHAFRHAYALVMLDAVGRDHGEAVALQSAQRFLGHASVTTTATYLRRFKMTDAVVVSAVA